MKVQPLREVFEGLSDPLAGRRYTQPLGRTLTMVFLALVSGEDSERGISRWLEEQCWQLKRVFGFRGDDVPSYSTIRRALQAVDQVELETALRAWVALLGIGLDDEAWTGLAVDGKRLRGAEAGAAETLNILNAFSQRLGLVLGQRLVDSQTSEIPEILPLLEGLTLTGKVVTVDALHTQVKTAQAIVEKGGPT